MSGRLRIELCADYRLLGTLSRGADAVVLPELFDGGYAALGRGEGTHLEGDALLEALAGASARLKTTIVAGSVRLLGRRGRATNTSLVFARGRIHHRYDKIHLFRPAGDVRFFSPGRRAGTFVLRLGSARWMRAAVMLCYDLRFPELARALALRKAGLLFVLSRWPAARDLAWRTLLRARAIENQIFVVGCNAPDREGGRSYVYGPSGEEVCAMRLPRSRTVRVDLDTGMTAGARRLHRSLREAALLAEMKLPRWVGR